MAETYSPRPSLHPYPEAPITSLLDRSAQLWPDRIALADGATGAEYSFAAVRDAARGVARALQDRGLAAGDRVGLIAPNSPEWVVAFHGASYAGATVTTLNPLYTEREISHQFADSKPTVCFASEATADVARSVWGRDEGFHLTGNVWDLAAGGSGEPDPVSTDARTDVAVLPYSSGTTGPPKGVMLSHYNVVANVGQTLGTGLIDGYSVLIDFLPFFHIYGMVVQMECGLAAGATQVVIAGFDPQLFVKLVKEHQATNLFVVPPVMLALADAEDLDADFSSVRFVMSAAAPLPIDIARRVSERYGVEVIQGYGMTEASPVTHVSVMGRDKPGTVGPPVSDTRQRVVELDGTTELGFGEVGELLVQGPQVMQGYFNHDDATAETLLHDDDGTWLRTGDIVTMDTEGYITITDRAKEMIKYRGYQIAPAELEAVLVEHADIADAAVVPKEGDPGVGEIPVAFVVLRDGASLSAGEVCAHVEERVAPYKKVREVTFTDAIPKNPSGKILRRELKDQIRSAG